jgi:hypothetical protein
MDWNKNILFIDNENKNWMGDMDVFSEVIGYIEVDSETPNKLLNNSVEGFELIGAKQNRFFNEEYLRLFADENNTYAAYINDMNANDPKTTLTSYFNKAYPNNGIDAIMPQLNDWIDAHSNNGLNENSCLLFDWDRTITVVEGMLFGKNNELIEGLNRGTITYDDLLMFVMSSVERIESIRNMFEKIKTSGIKFYILTHNPNASKFAPSRRVYIELIKRLTGLTEGQIENILYSSVNNSGIYKKKISACKAPIETIKSICERIMPVAYPETNAIPNAMTKPMPNEEINVETKAYIEPRSKTRVRARETTDTMSEMQEQTPMYSTRKRKRGGYKSKKNKMYKKNRTNRRKKRMGKR